MNSPVRARAALLLAATVSVFALSEAALAASCPTSGAASLPVGTVVGVPAGGARTYAITLAANEGVIVDLTDLKPRPAETEDEDEEEGSSRATPAPVRAMRLCDASGTLLAPQPGEVFAKGGSVVSTDDGERLRFLPGASGQYILTVAAGEAPREILVRRREVGSVQAPIIAAALDAPQKGIASSGAPVVYSFAGTAGQWVELRSKSEKDTLLRLAAPDRSGAYAVLVENDDSDGLNPVIRRRLPVTGTYYLQVDSLASEPGEFDLTLNRISAPKPPPPPATLRAGTAATGRLADDKDVRMYALPVLAGHSYRVELTAPYDGVVGVGVGNPLEPDDGGTGADAGYADVKSADTGTTGTEKIDFTARSNGTLLVRVKSFGIGESDGGYTLKVDDLGG